MGNRSFATVPRLSTTQKIAYTGVAGTSAAVGSQTRQVRVTLSSAGYIKIGSGAAVVTDTYMPANVPEYFAIQPGETVSAIQDAAGGNLLITELTQ